MNTPLDDLLGRYNLSSVEDARLALRETAQRIALLGLWRGKFFEHAAFYGGTAFRIIHNSPRFSEDMDFSLLAPVADFSLQRYVGFLETELAAFGFEVKFEPRERYGDSRIDGAFLKMNTRQGLMSLGVPDSVVARNERNRLLKIKVEVDTDPPPGFGTQTSFVSVPQAFAVRSYDLPSMFAGKVHAALARAWQGRVKGRDWFDLVWLVGRGVAVSMQHLRARLVQTGQLRADEVFGPEQARERLRSRIQSLDFTAARQDVEPFIKDTAQLEVWGPELFLDVVGRMQFA